MQSETRKKIKVKESNKCCMVMKVDYGHCTISVKWLQKSHVSLVVSLTICYACWLSKNDLTKLQANLLSNLKSKLKGTGFSSITILFDPWDSWIAMIKISSFNNQHHHQVKHPHQVNQTISDMLLQFNPWDSWIN